MWFTGGLIEVTVFSKAIKVSVSATQTVIGFLRRIRRICTRKSWGSTNDDTCGWEDLSCGLVCGSWPLTSPFSCRLSFVYSTVCLWYPPKIPFSASEQSTCEWRQWCKARHFITHNVEQLHDTHEQGCEEGLYGLCLYTVCTAAWPPSFAAMAASTLTFWRAFHHYTCASLAAITIDGLPRRDHDGMRSIQEPFHSSLSPIQGCDAKNPRSNFVTQTATTSWIERSQTWTVTSLMCTSVAFFKRRGSTAESGIERFIMSWICSCWRLLLSNVLETVLSRV